MLSFCVVMLLLLMGARVGAAATTMFVSINCDNWNDNNKSSQLIINVSSNTTYSFEACSLPTPWTNASASSAMTSTGNVTGNTIPSVLFVIPDNNATTTSGATLQNVNIQLLHLCNVFPIVQLRAPLSSIVNVSIVMENITIESAESAQRGGGGGEQQESNTTLITMPSATSIVEINALQLLGISVHMSQMVLAPRLSLTDAPLVFFSVRRNDNAAMRNASRLIKDVMKNVKFHCIACRMIVTSSTSNDALNAVLASVEVERGNQQPAPDPADVGLSVSDVTLEVRDSIIQIPALRLRRETHVVAVTVPESCTIFALSTMFDNTTVLMTTICAPLTSASYCIVDSSTTPGNSDSYVSVLGLYRDIISGLHIVMRSVNATLLTPLVDARGERISTRGGLVIISYSIAHSETSTFRGNVRDVVVDVQNSSVKISTRQVASLMYIQSTDAVNNFTFLTKGVVAELTANGSVVLTTSARFASFLLVDVALTQQFSVSITNSSVYATIVSGEVFGSESATNPSYLVLSIVGFVTVLGKVQHANVSLVGSSVFAEASGGSVPYVYGLPLNFHHTFGAMLCILDRDSTGSTPHGTSNLPSTTNITQDMNVDILGGELWCLFGMYMPTLSFFGFASTTSTFVSLPIVAANLNISIVNVLLYTGAAGPGAFVVPSPSTFGADLHKTFFNFSAIVSCYSTAAFLLEALPVLPMSGYAKAPSVLSNSTIFVRNAAIGTTADGQDRFSNEAVPAEFFKRLQTAAPMQNVFTSILSMPDRTENTFINVSSGIHFTERLRAAVYGEARSALIPAPLSISVLGVFGDGNMSSSTCFANDVNGLTRLIQVVGGRLRVVRSVISLGHSTIYAPPYTLSSPSSSGLSGGWLTTVDAVGYDGVARAAAASTGDNPTGLQQYIILSRSVKGNATAAFVRDNSQIVFALGNAYINLSSLICAKCMTVETTMLSSSLGGVPSFQLNSWLPRLQRPLQIRCGSLFQSAEGGSDGWEPLSSYFVKSSLPFINTTSSPATVPTTTTRSIGPTDLYFPPGNAVAVSDAVHHCAGILETSTLTEPLPTPPPVETPAIVAVRNAVAATAVPLLWVSSGLAGSPSSSMLRGGMPALQGGFALLRLQALCRSATRTASDSSPSTSNDNDNKGLLCCDPTTSPTQLHISLDGSNFPSPGDTSGVIDSLFAETRMMMHGAMIGNLVLVAGVVLLQLCGRQILKILAKRGVKAYTGEKDGFKFVDAPNGSEEQSPKEGVDATATRSSTTTSNGAFMMVPLSILHRILHALCADSTLISSLLTPLSLLLMPTVAVGVGVLFGGGSGGGNSGGSAVPGAGAEAAAVVTLLLWIGLPVALVYILLVKHRPLPLWTVRRTNNNNSNKMTAAPNSTTRTIPGGGMLPAARTRSSSADMATHNNDKDMTRSSWCTCMTKTWVMELMAPAARWKSIRHRGAAAAPSSLFLSFTSGDRVERSLSLGRALFKSYGSLFEGFYRARFWYFTVEFGLAIAAGVVTGASFATLLLISNDTAASSILDPTAVCSTIRWCGALLAALAVAEILLCACLKPHLVPFERYSSILVAALAAASEIAAMSTDDDSEDDSGTVAASALAICATIVQFLSLLITLAGALCGVRPWSNRLDSTTTVNDEKPTNVLVHQTKARKKRVHIVSPPEASAIMSSSPQSPRKHIKQTVALLGEQNLHHLITSICKRNNSDTPK